MIYFKRVIRKLNKYTKEKNERKYEKLEIIILKKYYLK